MKNIEENQSSKPLLFTSNRFNDSRGFLQDFVTIDNIAMQYGLSFHCQQVLFSYNIKKNTIRGMHFQDKPFEQGKIITCIKGSILDVAVDIRPDSDTYLKVYTYELNDKNNQCFFIPKGFAHGYQTLEDDTLVSYIVEGDYNFEHSRGIHYDDKEIGIEWRQTDSSIIVSEKDSNLGTFQSYLRSLTDK